MVLGASSLVPMIQMLRSFSSLSVRARLVTMKYGMVSAAPLATLATVALMPEAWSLGAMTACTPAPSATRKQAPRLCGSVTPSSTRISGGVRCSGGSSALAASRSSSSSSSECTCAMGCTRAAMPWCPWPPHILDRRAPSDSISLTPASLARSRKLRMRASRRVGSKWISRMDWGAVLRRTPRAWKPKRTLDEDMHRLSRLDQLSGLDGDAPVTPLRDGPVMGDQHQRSTLLAVQVKHQLHDFFAGCKVQ